MLIEPLLNPALLPDGWPGILGIGDALGGGVRRGVAVNVGVGGAVRREVGRLLGAADADELVGEVEAAVGCDAGLPGAAVTTPGLNNGFGDPLGDIEGDGDTPGPEELTMAVEFGKGAVVPDALGDARAGMPAFPLDDEFPPLALHPASAETTVAKIANFWKLRVGLRKG